MELLMLLLVPMGIAFLALPVVALIVTLLQRGKIASLSREVERIRVRLLEVERGSERPTAPVSDRSVPVAPVAPEASSPSPPPPAVAAPSIPQAVRRPRIDVATWLGRAPAWLGSAALALAGAFLVKYGWDRDWLGPVARVAIALGFGLACIGAGQVLVRRAAAVANGLVAAGIAVLYAATLAGVHHYALIPPAVGFAMLAIVTAAGVGLTLRHGPWVAILGLVGGYLTPVWIGREAPAAPVLFLYLALLHIGLVAVGRAGRRPLLPLASAASAFLWAIASIVSPPATGIDLAVLGAFVLVLVGSTVAIGQADPSLRGRRVGRVVSLAGPALGLALFGALVQQTTFETAEWVLFGMLAAGCMALARARRELEAVRWIALAATLILALGWCFDLGSAETVRFATVCAVFGSLFSLVGATFARGRGGRFLDAAFSAAAPVLFGLVAWLGLRSFPAIEVSWIGIAAGAGVAQAAFAFDAIRRRSRLPDGARVGSIHVVGAALTIALGMAIDLPRGALVPGLALVALAVVRVHAAFDARETRICSLALAVLATVTALDAPFSAAWPFGAIVLAVSFGAAAAALAVGARVLRRGSDEDGVSVLGALVAVTVGALGVFEVRHAFGPGTDIRLLEWGVLAALGIVHGLVVRLASRRFRVRYLGVAGDAVALGTIVVGAATLLVAHNPAFRRFDVGGLPVWNALLPAYFLPCLAAVAFARLSGRAGHGAASTAIAGAFAAVVAFAGVSLQVTQAFRGGVLAGGVASEAELYAYSAAWIVFSLVLLAIGIRSRAKLPRIASAVVMGLAIVKVFLFDTGRLEGLYRVGSLLGLGATLLSLAYVYQRWVFGARGEPTAQTSNASGSQASSRWDGGAM